MTLTELRYLVALAKEQHFAQAATTCCVSASTLSMAIRRLESEFGGALFDRSSAGVRITPLGEQIVVRAQQAVAHADTITTLAATSTQPLAEPLTIGAPHTIGPYFFPLMIPHLRQLTTNPHLQLKEGDGNALAKRLAQGELDALLTSLPFEHPDTVTRTLFDEPLVVIMPPRHTLAARPSLTPEDLLNQEVLLPDANHCLRQQILEACPQLGDNGKAHTAAEGGTLETLRHMVVCSLGLAIVPLSAVGPASQTSENLTSRPFADPSIKRTLGLAWRASFPRHDAIDILITALLACSPEYWLHGWEPQTGVLVENQYW
jgi:LysR family transcriptional regulator, hydrogen peroxide-inducible genes activator